MCPAECCTEQLSDGRLFCEPHWMSLPLNTKMDLFEQYPDGPRWQEAMDLCIRLTSRLSMSSSPSNWLPRD